MLQGTTSQGAAIRARLKLSADVSCNIVVVVTVTRGMLVSCKLQGLQLPKIFSLQEAVHQWKHCFQVLCASMYN